MKSIIWTIFAIKLKNQVFTIVGVLFTLMAIVQLVVAIRNTVSKNRYSIYDITEDNEEVDPLQQRLYPNQNTKTHSENFAYCPKCGKALK